MQQFELKFDLIIHGGGMVGAATALRLADAGFAILLIERYPAAQFNPDAAMALRVSAINLASEQFLASVGVWDAIQQLRVCPYRYLGVWEDPSQQVRFDAEEIGRNHLGHIVENTVLQSCLWQRCQKHPKIRCLAEQSITEIRQTESAVFATLDSGANYATRLLVGADGANSVVRQLAGIGSSGWDYAQHALVVAIDTEAEQQDITWQQFYPSGPRAFLPLSGKHASLVWYDSPEQVQRLSKLSAELLRQEIKRHFPAQLGEFQVDRVASFPLTRRHAQRYIQGRVVLLGDAAHTINPLAGQGVNLGFKDAEALCSVIITADQRGAEWHSQPVLRQYTRQRRPDNSLMIAAMDSLYAIFSNQHAGVSQLRKTGLKLAAELKPARIAATRYACGLL